MRFSTSTALSLAVLAAVLAAAAGCRKSSSSNPVPAPATPTSPSISGMTPAQGDVGGSETVTVNGSNFLTGAGVTIGGATASVQSVISNAIVVLTPTGTQGAATVVVTNPGGAQATLTNGFTYTSGGVGPTPTFTSITPATGFQSGGQTVTIDGSGFQSTVPAATVTIGGQSCTSVNVISGTRLTCVTANSGNPAGLAAIVFTNNDTTTFTANNAYTFVPAPTIGSISPANGPQTAPGTTTININSTATDFVLTPALPTVTFNGVAAAITASTTAQLQVTLPASSTSGVATVVVTNPDGQTATDSSSFTYDPPPGAPTAVSPTFGGALAGGNTITVTAAGMLSGAQIQFGSGSFLTTSNFQVGPPAQADVVVPAGSAGSVTLTVRNPDQQTATSATALYTYNPAPAITSLDVTSGPTTGGTRVTIAGSGFLAGATVQFGANFATVVNIQTGSIAVDTPSGSAGAVAVTVTNLDGQTATLGSAFTYTTGGGGGNPTVASISPSSGTVNGGTPVTVTGTNFLTGATADINGTALQNLIVVNATTLTGTTQAGTGTNLTVQVTTSVGSGSTASLWSYTAGATAPTVSSVTPVSSGLASGGDVITVTGSGFSTPTVTIDGVDQPVSISGAGMAVITTAGAGPCGPGGARDVKVTNGNGETGTGTGLWTYTHNIPEALTPIATNPDITIDGPGNLHVVFQVDIGSGNSEVMHVRSTDNGRTWTGTPNRLSNSSNPSLSPRIAASGNTIVVVWDEQNSTTHTVDYTYSTDNGVSWAVVANIPNGGSNGLALLATPDISIDANGQITAAWVELGPTPPPPSLSGPDTQVWTRSGTTTGLTSGTATQLSGTGTLIGGISISADGSGNVIVVWGQGVNGPAIQLPQHIYASRSTNGGTNWSAALQVRNGGGQLNGAPEVALKGSDAVIAYCSTVAGPQYLCGTFTSVNSGTSWSAGTDVRAAGANVVTTAAVAADAAGWFVVTYSDQGSSQTNVHCSRSSDVGTTWTTPLAFNPTGQASSVPKIAGGAAGTFKHVWSESNGGGQDVRQW